MSDTLTLLPPNATATERALARVVGRTTALAVGPKYRALWSPQTCPAGILPWIAWSLRVDEWDPNWTEQQKRDVIEASVAVHKTKGTIGALKRALAALGYEVTVDENTGEVYTFRLEFDLNQTGVLGTDTFAAARRVALANKNARSKLLAVRSSLTATAGVYGAVAHHRAQTVTVSTGTYVLEVQTWDGVQDDNADAVTFQRTEALASDSNFYVESETNGLALSPVTEALASDSNFYVESETNELALSPVTEALASDSNFYVEVTSE